MEQSYDVFKGSPKKKPFWLGSVCGLQRAVDQMNRMAERSPGDYFVYDAAADEVVATIQRSAPGPIQAIPIAKAKAAS